MSERMGFLKATGGRGWKTLEVLVADLDRAGYWKGEWDPVEKRRHVRKMLATLVFREATQQPGAEGAQRHVFVSTIKTGDSGKPLRVYKQVFDLTPEELQVSLEEAANRTDRDKEAARLLEADPNAFLLDKLTEETMQRAWPGLDPVQRRRVVMAALIQHKHSEETLRVVSERCSAEGYDIKELLDEYLRAAGAPRPIDAREADDIAGSATEYFKVMDELGGLDLKRMCFEALMEARTSAVEEFAEREGLDFKEATSLLAGELGDYADEFQGVLEVYRRDNFGWTLNEHLWFATERR